MAPREDLELGGLQLEHGFARSAFLARRGPGQFGEFADHRVRLGAWHVVFESIFSRDGLCGPIRHDITRVDTARQFVKADAVATEAAFERGQV